MKTTKAEGWQIELVGCILQLKDLIDLHRNFVF